MFPCRFILFPLILLAWIPGRAKDFQAKFYFRPPQASSSEKTASPTLLLVLGGIGSDGHVICHGRNFWTEFADENQCWLLSATFPPVKDVHDRKNCYYYPESGSMRWLLQQIDALADKENIRDKKLLLYGISGGAHFVHRFTLWRPERVKAAVAYSAAWWDEPTEKIRTVPMLIMCGEEDPRYEPSIAFYRRVSLLGCPVLWRSFPRLAHEEDLRVIRLAQAFLRAFLDHKPSWSWVGDIQEWRTYPADSLEVREIPLEYRVKIPSEEVARLWEGKP